MLINRHKPLFIMVIIVLVNILMVTSCSTAVSNTETARTTQATLVTISVPESTVTPTSTPVPVPLAMRINGQGIPLAEYEAEKSQLLGALEENELSYSEDEINQMLEDYFIDMELLAQAADQEGYLLSPGDLTQKLDELKQSAGGEQEFASWLAANSFNDDVFQSIYKRELAAAWKRDQIVASVGETAEQVQARQILVSDKDLADQIYRQLQSGADFATLAEDYDPLTKGVLGWFPIGFLFLPEIEEAAFTLQPGEYSGVIQTAYGYHIVQVIDRDANHPLSAEARQTLAHTAVSLWLEEQRNQSNIELLLP
jgi:peptidyl-prolyl cis-trans isomerase C